MSKHISPLLGYNNNVRHKGRVFHIQTEDSGVKRPHIITHLFMDGGRILKSTKTSYAEHVGSDNLTDTVRAMMKEQHKAMFEALRAGQFDHLLEVRGSLTPPAMPAMEAPVIPPLPPPPISDPAPITERESEPDRLTLDLDVLEESSLQPEGDLPPPPANVLRKQEPAAGRYRALRDPRSDPDSSGTMRAAPKVEPERHDTRVEHVDLRRSGAPKSRPPPSVREPKPASTRDAKPASVREAKPASARDPRAVDAKTAARKRASSPPPPPSERPRAAREERRSSKPPKQGDARYAPARPAAIFGPAKPQSSIFGEDLISDKSLDEVILSYLAEDLEGDK